MFKNKMKEIYQTYINLDKNKFVVAFVLYNHKFHQVTLEIFMPLFFLNLFYIHQEARGISNKIN